MFQLSECARRCSSELLDKYLETKRLPKLPKGVNVGKKLGEAFIQIVNSASLAIQAEIEVELQIVQEMTGGAQVRLLTERTKRDGLELPKDFDELATHDKALWIFMNAPELFMATVMDCEIEDTKSWITYRVPLIDKSVIPEKSKEIGEVVSDHYRSSGLARFCQTIQINKDGYSGVAAYPLNYAKNQEGYDEKGALINKKIAPVFNIYFLYIPIEKENAAYLSVKIKDGGRGNIDIEFLAKGFVKRVFDKVLTESDRVRYNLDKLQDINVTFTDIDDADMIENIKVISIVLWNPGFPANISLRASAKKGNFNMSDIGECLRKLNINSLRGFQIVNAELRFQFKKERRDWKSKGVVCAKINTNKNSSCNLGISGQHLMVRKYLRKWGIEGK